ncbi:MAG TPA: periplasmic heavy metal sensor [Terracidiphilus sp.]|nr:periplasmic heavy metal sensor [Terracidiphilus sp.]
MKTVAMSILGLAMALAVAGSITAGAQADPQEGPGFGMHRPPMERLLGPGGAMGRWWNNPKVIDQLKLTDDQRKDMDQILLQHREELIDMRASVEKAELAMEPLLNVDQPNEQAVLAQIDKVAQARAELEKANARFLLALRAKLTPDQYKQLQTWRSQVHNRPMRQWRKGGPGAPGGPGPDGQPGPQGGPGAPPPPDSQ